MHPIGPPLQGLNHLTPQTQGVALGWYGAAPLGRSKEPRHDRGTQAVCGIQGLGAALDSQDTRTLVGESAQTRVRNGGQQCGQTHEAK